ncbi:MAG: glycosyltransferase [Paracoccaceae bacterium]|nr:glycosyltransferase [Paracoccaceae bacterium]
MKVMIVVTHLLGTGHLSRALTIANAFKAAGHNATVVSGGTPAPQLSSTGLNLLQLPSLRSDGVNFTRLLTEEGDEAGQDTMSARAQMLERALSDIQPDVLITELFPFGRRVLATEFRHLLDLACKLPMPPLICASIRDILAPPSKPAKAQATENMITTYYDAVLVHSDPEVTPLEISWPVTRRLAPLLHYTGFVAPPIPESKRQRSNTVLISAGGGDVGAELFCAALTAATLDPMRRWHLLVGGRQARENVSDLQARAPANVVVEPARPDFRELLKTACASVSMAGYNTALDVLQTGTPAVLVPFDAGNEVEQTLRAQALAKLPGISVLTNADLTGAALLEHVRKVTRAIPRLPQTKGMDGAAKTVGIVEALKHER